LDLAQYRELAAFTKFGAELDRITQAQLNRGERLVEVLKQNQCEPMPVEDQIAIIFIANEGFLDDLPLNRVKSFEAGFLSSLRENYALAREKLRSQKELTPDIADALKKAAQAFKEGGEG
jgi:F-type H+-transporting ATPase subunit alpha